MIDRELGHGGLWSAIAAIWIMLIVIVVVAAGYDYDHERRIIGLEKRCGIQGQR